VINLKPDISFATKSGHFNLLPTGFPSDSLNPIKLRPPHLSTLARKTSCLALFPVATMLEKLGFKKLIDETLTIHRNPRAMTI
jgi:hypothetical protein